MGKGIAIVLSLFVVTSANAGLGEELCSNYSLSDNCSEITSQFYCDEYGIGEVLCNSDKMSRILNRMMTANPSNLDRQALIITELQDLSMTLSMDIPMDERRGVNKLANLVMENWIEATAAAQF